MTTCDDMEEAFSYDAGFASGVIFEEQRWKERVRKAIEKHKEFRITPYYESSYETDEETYNKESDNDKKEIIIDYEGLVKELGL
jgi:hypothetical protein